LSSDPRHLGDDARSDNYVTIDDLATASRIDARMIAE
jgi:hypothetical protein